MTEIERIIKEGILPESFFKSETICDFYVDESRKKVWAICLDLLREFDSICRKHNLRYFLSFGSLLGAIRHNGFIPWDDDMDVCMLREDYEKLLTLKDEFSGPYFLQQPCCDNGYYFSFAKLRNSNTSGIVTAFVHSNFNQGLFLDIFPLDSHRKESEEVEFEQMKKLLVTNSTNMKRHNPNPSEDDELRYAIYPQTDPLQTFDCIEKLAQLHKYENAEYVCTRVMTIYPWRKCTWRRSDVENLKEITLYGLKTYIPQNYDAVLKVTYGDYMEFPPVEKRGCWHSGYIMNPDVPYNYIVNDILSETL